MKKIILSFTLVLLLIMFIPKVEAKNKVNVYVFSREGCSACERTKEYLDNLLEEDKNAFDFIEIKVFDEHGNVLNSDARKLMVKVLEANNQDTETIYTPAIVIGNYFSNGFPSDENEINNAINDLKNSEEEIDNVASLAKEENINIDKIRVSVAKENTKDAIIMVAIFVVLIGAFTGLIFVSKK